MRGRGPHRAPRPRVRRPADPAPARPDRRTAPALPAGVRPALTDPGQDRPCRRRRPGLPFRRNSMSDRKPRIGILGIMQDLYDEMIPDIAARQAGYAREIAAHLADVGEFIPSEPIKYREDAERAMREFENGDLDGVMVVMLTYGPAMRVARLLNESRLPILMANIQPEPQRHPGLGHGRHDLQPGRARRPGHRERDGPGGPPVRVLTDDWRSERVPRRRGPVGARGGGGDRVEVAEGRDLRLRDERHGRHPGGRERADPQPGPGDPGGGARGPVPRHAGGHQGAARRGHRVRGRALRDRPGAVGGGAGRPRPDAGRDQADPGRAAATAPTPRTSTRSARTAGSPGCRWPPPPR